MSNAPASWSAKRCSIWKANREKPVQPVAPNTERQQSIAAELVSDNSSLD
jgi:hypothetical protein